MSLKKNIVANYFGQGWSAIMNLAFIPMYIKYLGIEAYGLIGIFTLFQAWLALLDMGMSPALSREMARFTGGAYNPQSIRDLLRSVEIIGVGVAILVAFMVWVVSGWLASDWLKTDTLSVDAVTQAFVIMGVVGALRFIENIYRSSIVGLQKQVILNVVTSGTATLRGVGAVCVLVWVAPTINVFFVWQGIVSAISVAFFIVILYRGLPRSQHRGRFSRAALINIWRYAAGVMFITFLSFLLMQTDKILLSRLLSLEHFGYYALAAMVANSLYMLVTPFDLAFFPLFTALASQEDQASLIANYHLGSQLITVFVGASAIVLILFGDMVLTLWTRDAELAQRVAPLLSILSTGTLLNCFMHMPYQLQLAHGWTRLTIYVNIVAVSIIVPAFFWVAPRYGAVGVAWIWVVLNASYIFFAVHFMFQRLLTTEKWCWYRQDIAIPMITAAVTAGVARGGIPNDVGALGLFVWLVFSAALTLAAAALTAPLVRQHLYLYLTKMRNLVG